MTAMEMGLKMDVGGFLHAIEEHQRQAMIDLATMDPLVEIIESNCPFQGTATKLQSEVREYALKRERWPAGIPRQPNRLVDDLRRLAPELREIGIEVILDAGRDSGNRKTIEIRKFEEDEF